jgi:RNA polymerase sigma-70 factor (ECF subfamily)
VSEANGAARPRARHDRAAADPAAAASADDLVARLKAGDARAFDAIYHEFVGPLRVYAHRHVRSREAAVEIVHDVFLAVWRGRAELAVRSGLAAYLYGATRNRSLDWLAREGVRRRWHDREVAHGAADAHAVDAAADAEDADVLTAVVGAIEAMPERRRVVCSLRWREGMSLAEIATSLGISQKTVETQLSRALKQLRAQFHAH